MNTIITFMENLVGDNKEKNIQFKQELREEILEQNAGCKDSLSILSIANVDNDVSNIVKNECNFLRNLGWNVTACDADYCDRDKTILAKIQANK